MNEGTGFSETWLDDDDDLTINITAFVSVRHA